MNNSILLEPFVVASYHLVKLTYSLFGIIALIETKPLLFSIVFSISIAPIAFNLPQISPKYISLIVRYYSFDGSSILFFTHNAELNGNYTQAKRAGNCPCIAW